MNDVFYDTTVDGVRFHEFFINDNACKFYFYDT